MFIKRRKLFILILIIIFAIILGFISKPFGVEKPKVVIILKDVNSQYWEIVKAGAEKGFRDFRLDGKIIAPVEGTAEEQANIIKNIYKENPDVLIVAPTSSLIVIPALDDFVKKYKDIPVLLLDTDDPWKHKTSYIGTDNLDLGKRAGAFLASQLQPGDKVALIGGDPEIPVSGERIQGAKITLKEAGINIATEKVGLNNENDEKKAMETILRDHRDVKGIIASNDGMALNALKVIEEHGLKMPVTGADGITEMLELIEEGTLPGSVAQNPYDMGYLSVETALKVTKGEKVEKNVDSGVDIIIKDNAEQRLNFLTKLLN
ncbi:sugar ABC transporter substrate-binding protein [Metabacillus herbersteinensis]|uniref:Sugar ABC transporter substrate-binding protein n=1 Tax=Metabacillus herbersteinensis TaxID=283816 RepID=A0ABV6GJH0_9BACI